MFQWKPSERYPRYEWVNDAIVTRTKLDREVLLGADSVFLRIGKNERLVELARERVERDDPSPFEVELTTSDGAKYWVEVVAQRLEAAADGSLRFVCATHTISRRKEHERYRLLLGATIDNEPDGVFIVRLRGENRLSPPVLYANPAFSQITGYTEEDLSAGIYPRLFGEDTDRATVDDHARSILSGERVVAELKLYRKDGTQFLAEVRAHPLESPAIHCALSIHDITERRQAQEAMNVLSEGISQASDFMIVTDETAASEGGPRILQVNRSFLEATGYQESDLVGQAYTVLYSPRNVASLMQSIQSAIAAGQANEREILAQRKDGSEFWMEFVDRPFVTGYGRRLRLMVGRDITVRRRSTNQLSLLFVATEQAETPIVIYDSDESGRLAVSYENDAAAARGYYHLLELWERGDAEGRSARSRLEHGEPVTITYTHLDANGSADLVQIAARPIRNQSRLEAILTQERVLSTRGAGGGDSAQSRLIDLAMMLPALERSIGLPERLKALRALLHNAFDASLEMRPFSMNGAVHIDEERCIAVFARDGISARVTWPKRLEPLAVTALRFAIEAALDGV